MRLVTQLLAWVAIIWLLGALAKPSDADDYRINWDISSTDYVEFYTVYQDGIPIEFVPLVPLGYEPPPWRALITYVNGDAQYWVTSNNSLHESLRSEAVWMREDGAFAPTPCSDWDFNFDNVVGGPDFAVFRRGFGTLYGGPDFAQFAFWFSRRCR